MDEREVLVDAAFEVVVRTEEVEEVERREEVEEVERKEVEDVVVVISLTIRTYRLLFAWLLVSRNSRTELVASAKTVTHFVPEVDGLQSTETDAFIPAPRAKERSPTTLDPSRNRTTKEPEA